MGMIFQDPLLPADPLWSPERALALGVAFIDTVICYFRYRGSDAFTLILFTLGAVLLVWFPDAMGYLYWVRAAGHGRGSAPAPETFVRVLGWSFLAFPILAGVWALAANALALFV